MPGPAQKCENDAFSEQKYALKLFLAPEMDNYYCFNLGKSLDFLDWHRPQDLKYYFKTSHR